MDHSLAREDRSIDHGALEEGRHVNYWDLDPALRTQVRRTYPEDDLDFGEERLRAFGEAVGQRIADNADVLDRNDPELHTFDRDGDLVNEVEYHPAQAENDRLVVEHGAVADLFDPPAGRDEPLPYLHGLAMDYLMNYADTGLTCPVAMTQGVGLVLEKFDEGALGDALAGIAARDPDRWKQGAMFLTESQGGSDVGAAETEAVPAEPAAERGEPGSVWHLTGEKWFCSNVDAGAPLVLARRPDGDPGTAGLSLFLMPRTNADGEPNDYRIRRLKDKLGTKSVPTGEIELEGAEAYLVGDPENGFKQMAEMLNLERVANAMGAMGLTARALLEAKIHAADREAFGASLDSHALMKADLVDLTVDHEAGTAFTFEAARAFSAYHDARRRSDADAEGHGDGAGGHGDAEREAYRLMRVLVPVSKLRTARIAIDTASYAMEIFGGNGYVDDWVTHRLFRDAQVLPIWEGTENILSLDVLRALATEAAHEPLLDRVDDLLARVDHRLLADLAGEVHAATDDLGEAFATMATLEQDAAELHAKRLSELVFDVVAAAVLLDGAQTRIDEDDDARDALVAKRFVDRTFRDAPVRGIVRDDRLALEHFDAISRFERVAPGSLDAPL